MSPRPYRSSRRRLSAERTRARLLKAASATLADREVISLDAVAKRAGGTRLTVYNQFVVCDGPSSCGQQEPTTNVAVVRCARVDFLQTLDRSRSQRAGAITHRDEHSRSRRRLPPSAAVPPADRDSSWPRRSDAARHARPCCQTLLQVGPGAIQIDCKQ